MTENIRYDCPLDEIIEFTSKAKVTKVGSLRQVMPPTCRLWTYRRRFWKVLRQFLRNRNLVRRNGRIIIMVAFWDKRLSKKPLVGHSHCFCAFTRSFRDILGIEQRRLQLLNPLISERKHCFQLRNALQRLRTIRKKVK